MPSEMHLAGLEVAPGVLETIVALAAEQVDGVACVEGGGLAGLMKQKPGSRGVEVAQGDDGAFAVVVHVSVRYGTPVRTVAASVQSAVADALLSQIGNRVATVDVFIDGIVFPE